MIIFTINFDVVLILSTMENNVKTSVWTTPPWQQYLRKGCAKVWEQPPAERPTSLTSTSTSFLYGIKKFNFEHFHSFKFFDANILNFLALISSLHEKSFFDVNIFDFSTLIFLTLLLPPYLIRHIRVWHVDNISPMFIE